MLVCLKHSRKVFSLLPKLGYQRECLEFGKWVIAETEFAYLFEMLVGAVIA